MANLKKNRYAYRVDPLIQSKARFPAGFLSMITNCSPTSIYCVSKRKIGTWQSKSTFFKQTGHRLETTNSSSRA